MKLEILQIPIDQGTFQLMLDGKSNYISFQGDCYFSLEEINRDFSQFFVEERGPLLAQLSNFLFEGLNYTLIDDVSAYKERYERQVELETSGKATGGFLVTQYGHFNTDEISLPRIEQDKLTFFVESNTFAIPYKALCILPTKGRPSSCSYTLLPQKS